MSQSKSGECACNGIGPAVTALLGHFEQSEAGTHFGVARIEFLKGLRSILDARIQQLSKPPQQHDPGTSVPVE